MHKMKILLFGVSNVGKTTVGEILADKIGYDFYDIDFEIKNDTISLLKNLCI